MMTNLFRHKYVRFPGRKLTFAMVACMLMYTTCAQALHDQQRLTVAGKNITIQKVFQTIKKKTGLTVFYSNDLLNDAEKINIDFHNENLGTVLDYILEDKNISYEVRRNKVIVLSRKPEKKELPKQV